MAVTTQQNAEIIEPGDHALQLDPVDQKNCDGNFGFANIVKERILKVLFIASHVSAFSFMPRIDKPRDIVFIPQETMGECQCLASRKCAVCSVLVLYRQ
ncbi:hypothetical protein GGE09_002378 [Roseobacter sp. N2S]|nr:hypothetical protein [Roseobacter sp. N2S]